MGKRCQKPPATDKQAELKDLISQIEAGPEAGKTMATRSLREVQIREIFKLGQDRGTDVSRYKIPVPETVTVP
ncbi:hypothetical protein CNMCM8980_001985 [Aspergillus fumigatiaffinis]|nr:hypothetical protein CNMCM5878_007051 [Aspergillus fumigatiaffinis]KAF4250126.1 hypothetical protein CNMCM8980_001985 [Aspergillus fumigatiaffinis]